MVVAHIGASVVYYYMCTQEVSRDACTCLKWKYKGNSYLEAGKVGLAIDAYNSALEKCGVVGDGVGEKQEGVILLLRSSAYLEQAQSHKRVLQEAMEEWRLPEAQNIQFLLSEALLGGPERAGLANSILWKLQSDGKRQQSELRKIQYHHGLYQYSLLHALQDSLRATEILPNYSTAWLRAGELLSQLWKLEESRQYHEKALSLDQELAESLDPILEDLKHRKDLLERARANKDWPEDSLRLALDVAG
jgi:tetratricopeptide (TPR) repeat protein